MAPKKSGTVSKKGGKGVSADGGRKKKKAKDPNMPKRGKSAYLYYSIEKRPEVLAKHPELANNVAEVAKIMGRGWSELNDKEKGKYNAMAEADKRRYDSEMAVYRNKK